MFESICQKMTLSICRDRSAAVTLKRVPTPGGKDGELMDEWLEFYHRPENEPEFPLRNEQVNKINMSHNCKPQN